jgi:two-component system chemotaxis response regulator CheY
VKQRVLIVKDSPTMRQSLAFALKRMKNIEIVEVQDGIRGLCKVPRDHFDLVLIDIRMLVMDGLTLISRVRDEQNLRRMPICVIATEGANEGRARDATGRKRVSHKPIQTIRVLSISKMLLKVESCAIEPPRRVVAALRVL